MKRISFLLVATLLFSACQKIKNLSNIGFDIPVSQTIDIPQVSGYTFGMSLPPGGLELPFPAVSVATNAQQLFNQYHASSKNLISADLSSLSLQMLSPAGQNFDFLDSVQVFVSATDQQEVMIAYINSVPKGMTTLNFTAIPALNLKNYIVQDTIAIRLSAHINAVPASGSQVKLAASFHVVANPL